MAKPTAVGHGRARDEWWSDWIEWSASRACSRGADRQWHYQLVTILELDTPHGPARAHLHAADEPRAALVLGHGAAGGVEAPDLVAARDAALSEGMTVALVEQPYRVAGRRAPPRAAQLDAAWVAVVEHLRDGALAGLPLIVGGRSMGARVACRTVEETGAVAVLCLAFP